MRYNDLRAQTRHYTGDAPAMLPDIELLDDEEIRFRDEQVVVTNRRIINAAVQGDVGRYDGVSLGDVGPPNKFNGGQHGRRALGIRLLALGLIVVVFQTVFSEAVKSVFAQLEAALFLIGSLSAVVGLYFVLNSLFRPAPNTTIIFPVVQGEDIIASYPEWDNPTAEDLVRAFARAKRGVAR